MQMTHQTLTTNDQKEWLEPRKAAFLEAKQKGATSLKEFYKGIYKEFHEQWPVPAVTEREITIAGSAELATKDKHDKYDKVHACYFFHGMQLTKTYTAHARMAP